MMFSIKREPSYYVSGLILGAVLGAVPTGARADDTGTIQEVVVTADKRTQDIKDVPISISSISGDDLNGRHIEDYDDLTRSIPSVSFASGGSEGLSNIEIRGVSSAVGSPVVGVYLDESSITQKLGQTQPIPFDLARVEVLRGPQGTLYGASSMGGAIRFITNQPSFDAYTIDLTSDISGTEHGGVNYNESAVLNAPVIADKLAFRLGVDYGSDSGYVDHYTTNGTLDDPGVNEVWKGVIKAAALIKPNDTLSITPSLWLQRVNSEDSSVFYPALGLYEQDKEVPEPSNDRLFRPQLDIEQSFPAFDVSSITSYFLRDDSRVTDGTYWNDAALADFYLIGNGGLPNHNAAVSSIIAHIPSPSDFSIRFDQITQELRFTSKPPGESDLPLVWTAGLYYSNQTIKEQNNEYSPGLNAAFQSIYGFPLSSPVVQAALGSSANTFDNDIIFVQPITERLQEYAAFGQFTYDILSSLHASAGLRYEYADTSYKAVSSGFYSIGDPNPYDANARFYAATPKFSVTYDVSDSTTVYSTIAKGYRLGGGTGPNPPSLCANDYHAIGIESAPTSYGSDHLWSYELGTKALLDDRTISIDASTYLIEWSNIQQTINLPTCGFSFTGNFGDAESYGAELQLAYKPRPIPNLTLGVNLGAGHSQITRSEDPSAAAVGQAVLYTPDWTMTATADYHWQATDAITAFVRTDYDWTGTSHGSYQATNSNYINPAYGVLNASIGIDTGSFQAYLYAKNLLDDQTIIQRPQIDSVIEGYTVRPLTVGLTVAKQF